jgi:hypothetical protein
MTLYGLELPDDLGGNGECECDELLIRGKRVPPPPGHDCEYVRARSALVPQAVKIADEKVATKSPSQDGGSSYATWSKVFAMAMDELSAPLLRQSGNGRA